MVIDMNGLKYPIIVMVQASVKEKYHSNPRVQDANFCVRGRIHWAESLESNHP